MSNALALPIPDECPTCGSGPIRHEAGQGRVYYLTNQVGVVLDLPWEVPVCRSCACVATTPEGGLLLARGLRASLWRGTFGTAGLAPHHGDLRDLFAFLLVTPEGEAPPATHKARGLWPVLDDYRRLIPPDDAVWSSSGPALDAAVDGWLGRLAEDVASIGTGPAPVPFTPPPPLPSGIL